MYIKKKKKMIIFRLWDFFFFLLQYLNTLSVRFANQIHTTVYIYTSELQIVLRVLSRILFVSEKYLLLLLYNVYI